MKNQLTTLCALLCAAACSSSNDNDGGTDGGAGAAFVGVGIRVDAPSGRTTYLGGFSTFPSGALDTSKMVQFINTDMSFYGGAGYVWDRDATTYTKYTIDSSGTMHKGAVLSFANLGVKGSTETTYVSATQAYAVLGDQLNAAYVVEWNPTTMTIIDSVNVTALNAPTSNTYEYGGPTNVGRLFGKYLAIPASWGKNDGSAVSPNATVVLVDTTNLHAAATVATDARCLGVSTTFVDPAGDLYVSGTSEAAFYAIAPPTSPATVPHGCVLRIKAGTTVFDPNFYVDVVAATSSRALYQTWHLSGDLVLADVIPTSETTTDLGQFYTEGTVSPYLLNLSTGAATALAPAGLSFHFENYFEWRYNDDLYYEDYTITEDGTRTPAVKVYKVSADGTFTPTFTIAGDLWALGSLTAQ